MESDSNATPLAPNRLASVDEIAQRQLNQNAPTHIRPPFKFKQRAVARHILYDACAPSILNRGTNPSAEIGPAASCFTPFNHSRWLPIDQGSLIGEHVHCNEEAWERLTREIELSVGDNAGAGRKELHAP
jgi:hypothetical protein